MYVWECVFGSMCEKHRVGDGGQRTPTDGQESQSSKKSEFILKALERPQKMLSESWHHQICLIESSLAT